MTFVAPTLASHLGDLLSAREAELRAGIRDTVADCDGAPEPRDFRELAALDRDAQVHNAAVQIAEREIALIQAALRSLDDGSYGLCHDCGEPIAESRLLAVPAATLCTACQSIHERRTRN